MTFSIRTKRVEMTLRVKTQAMDLHAGVSGITAGIPLNAGEATCATHRTNLDQPCATCPVSVAAAPTATVPADLISEQQTRVATTGMTFFEVAPEVSTRKISLDKPAGPHCHRLRMFTTDVATFTSTRVDAMPQTRDMINLRFLDYPRISEYITRMADEKDVSYSNIKLIGIYEPVPLHRAYNLVLDPLTGRLSFHVRPEDARTKKRFARVAYGRLRMSGEIIQTVYPVT